MIEEDGAARDFADSIPVTELPADESDPQYGGYVVVRTRSSGNWEAEINRTAGMSAADQESFAAWARERVYRLIVTGTPELDGWFKRASDDGWQITARAV